MRLVSSLAALALFAAPAFAADPPVTRSAKSGPWSAASTWDGNAVPGSGARVLILAGHAITYDVKSDAVIRGINVAGTLAFAPDMDTVLNVGLHQDSGGRSVQRRGLRLRPRATWKNSQPGSSRPELIVGTAAFAHREVGADPPSLCGGA